MAESFTVEPAQVAGFSTLAMALASQLGDLGIQVGRQTRPESGYTGVMELVKPAVELYADTTSTRLIDREDYFHQAATELNRAAWAYSGQEEANYTVIQGTDLPSYVGVEPNLGGFRYFDGPASYPPAAEPALDPPPHGEADIRALLDDVGGNIDRVDDAIAWLTSWSPVSELVEPMSGNWTELSRAGEALLQVGDGAEVVQSNVTAGLAQLDPHWDGGAAAAFTDWMTRVADGIGQEGPLNRVVGQVYIQVAGEVERVAHFMVETLGTAVDRIVEAAATSWVPGYGWKKIYDAVRSAIEVIQEAYDIIQDLKAVVEAVQAVVEAVQDPAAFAESWVLEKLEPVTSGIEDAQTGLQVGEDLAALADTSALDDMPTEDYGVGQAPRRDG